MDITDKTKVPLFAVLVTIPTLLGGVAWLSAIWQQGAEATKVNDRQDDTLKRQSEVLYEIRDRVVKIEEHLRVKDRR